MKEIQIPIVLIGHKDHGKSTLISRFLLDTESIKTGKVKEIKKVDKVFNQKFEMAHLIDSFREEREREMTIDTTQVLLKGKKRIYQLIDVPGHQELISQMLTGASAAEIALLVVSITEGIKEQTRQHLEIAKILGIEKIIVAINKMDEIGYQGEVFEELVEKLKKLLKKTGYLIKKIYFFPTSALKGDNVARKSFKTPWYAGPSLMEFLENKIKKPTSFEKLPLRFLVQDKYSEGGGEILVGRIESGKLKVGQELIFLPESQRNKIVSIRDSEDELGEAKAGQNIGIRLKEQAEATRGSVGVLSNSLPRVDNILMSEIFWIEKPIQKELILECGTTQTEGRLLKIDSIKVRDKSFSKIFLKKPIVFDPLSKTILGKIVLKDKGKIIGVGNVYAQ